MSETRIDLEGLRQQIDAIDMELLCLLNARATLVLEIQRLKRRLGLPAYSAAREEAILRGLSSANLGPFPAEAVEDVFRTVLRCSLTLLALQEERPGPDDPSLQPSPTEGEGEGPSSPPSPQGGEGAARHGGA